MMQLIPARVLSTVVVALMLVACERSSPAPPAGSASSPTDVAPRPTISPTTSTARGHCPNQARGVDEGDVLGGKVRGDVDGDGSADTVYLVADEAGAPDCRNLVVVETDDQRFVAPTNEQGVEYSLQIPRIHSLVQIDDEGGAEVLVDLEQGAATQFIGIFTIVEDELTRVVVQDLSDFGSLFPYGGSVGQLQASNCADDELYPARADVSLSVATANAKDYTIRTRLYDMEEGRLIPLPRRQQPTISTAEDLDQMVGFRSSPFGDCPPAGEEGG